MRKRFALIMLILAGAIGCGREGSPKAAESGEFFPLPVCSQPPASSGQAQPPSVKLPNDSVITNMSEEGPEIHVSGFVPSTPRKIRAELESRDDFTLILIEDEGYEAEAVVTDGTKRTFIKVRSVCKEGSTLDAVSVNEADADRLPSPGGPLSLAASADCDKQQDSRE